jgi:hypothetical protein
MILTSGQRASAFELVTDGGEGDDIASGGLGLLGAERILA